MKLTIYLIFISLINIIKSSLEYNRILLLLSLELLLISLALFFLFSSLFLDHLFGLFFSILLLCLGAIETAIGLSLLLLAS